MFRLLQRRICNPAAEKVRLSSSLSGNGGFPILKGHKAAQDLSKDTLKSHETIKDKEGMNKPIIILKQIIIFLKTQCCFI